MTSEASWRLEDPTRRLRVAVAGSGISGLASAWLLSRRHQVELFEKEPRLGGHAHTHDVEVEGRHVSLDSGFLVYNHRTYPNFVRLLERLGVPGRPSDMSFGVRCRHCRLEYSSRGPLGLFAQPRRLLDRGHWRMLADIPRFNAVARSFLAESREDTSLGALLAEHGLSEAFQRHFLLPMGGAIWSAPAGEIRRFSARSFLRFFENHGWLTLDGAPRWWTIEGGSRRYVEAISRLFARGIHLATPVEAVRRGARRVYLRVRGDWRGFDRVVLATHANQALRLLEDASAEERLALGAFRYSRNRTFLHTDVRHLPEARSAWASWNCDLDCRDLTAPASLTYHVNRLQSVPGPTQFCVTLNGTPPPEEHVIAEMHYEHPVMDAAATRAQEALQALSGARHTYYCGAHLRSGFHEDGLLSALAVGAHFGEALEPAAALARAS